MTGFPFRSISIAGEGVCTWLTALALARVLRGSCELRVFGNEDNPVEGALPAVPSLHRLLSLLRLDEEALLRATDATFRLGTRFHDWSVPGERFFQGFGPVGAKLNGVSFQHHWMRATAAGDAAAFEEYSMAAHAAKLGRFARPLSDPRSPLSLYSYAWHLDSLSLATLLRRAALHAGVVQFHGEPRVELDSEGGVRALCLDERRLETDFLIVCGARDRWPALEFGFEDWSAWLPCDRLQYTRAPPLAGLPPFVDSSAVADGWLYSVPLRHGVDRGYVYCSEFADDDLVSEKLAPDGRATRLREVENGRPKSFWLGNCLLLPGSGLDPLESTSLHLAQTGIARFLMHFPVDSRSPTDAAEYNRLTAEEYDGIRDLLALRYHTTQRHEEFWRRCRERSLPDGLQRRLALFADSGRITIGEGEHCNADSWLSVLLGMGLRPATYDPLAEGTSRPQMRAALANLEARLRDAAATLPLHREYLLSLGLDVQPCCA